MEVSEQEFRAFMRRTLPSARLPKPTGERPQRFQVVPAVAVKRDPAMDPMVEQYVSWCEQRGKARDCAGALVGGSSLDKSGKYKIAFDIALGFRWDGFTEELGGMVNGDTVRVVLLSMLVGYLAMLAFPGIVTQALAAACAVVLTAYLGARVFYELVHGWIEMVTEVNAATTFSQIHEAGVKFGKVIGANTARILIMVVTAVIAEGGLVARVLDLPKATEASALLAAESGGKLELGELDQVDGVNVAPSGVTVVLKPAAEVAQPAVAMAMAAQGQAVPPLEPCTDPEPGAKPDKHHISSNKNTVSEAQGGPWTQRFEKLFKKAGMTLEDPENIVEVVGHRGPHPQEYHEAIFTELDKALKGCRSTTACRQILVATLRTLAKEIATPGTDLNKLVRRCE